MTLCREKIAPIGVNPDVSTITWLFQREILSELSTEAQKWISANRESNFLIDYSAIKETRDLLGTNVNIPNLSRDICDSLELFFGHENTLDPLHIADFFFSHRDTLTIAFGRNINSTFLFNWKYSRYMRSSINSILGFLAHLIKPQIRPIDLSYRVLVQNIESILKKKDTQSLLALLNELEKQDIYIEEEFLQSILVNEPRFLLNWKNSTPHVGITEQILRGWPLAIDLLEPAEVLVSKGLSLYDATPFYEIELELHENALKRFFSFHNRNLDWEGLNTFEIAIKLRSLQSEFRAHKQGLPSNIHTFIVKWIKQNKRVWLSRDSERILGKKFTFSAAEISPGELMVYGNINQARDRANIGLVLKNMVSEGRQTRGMIHSTRVMTPFNNIELQSDSESISQILTESETFAKYGLVELERLAKQVLINENVQIQPYPLRSAEIMVREALKNRLEPLGRGIYADKARYTNIYNITTMPNRRRHVLSELVPQYTRRGLLSSDFEEEDKYLLMKLYG